MIETFAFTEVEQSKLKLQRRAAENLGLKGFGNTIGRLAVIHIPLEEIKLGVPDPEITYSRVSRILAAARDRSCLPRLSLTPEDLADDPEEQAAILHTLRIATAVGTACVITTLINEPVIFGMAPNVCEELDRAGYSAAGDRVEDIQYRLPITLQA